MKDTLPQGIPSTPLTGAAEADLASRIQAKHAEEDITTLAMSALHEALPYLRTVSNGRIAQDELMSIGYQGLYNAARNFKPGRLRFFSYAKVYLRGQLSRRWRSQDTVRNASLHEDPEVRSVQATADNDECAEPGYDLIEIKERWALVQPVMREKLTERERLIVELVTIGGYSFTKVGQLVIPKISRQATQVCYRNALKKVRLALTRKRAL